MKMQELLKEVRGGLFGKVTGMVYTIEFSKRGLLHMHLLIYSRTRFIILKMWMT
jgi:hypothetical protein